MFLYIFIYILIGFVCGIITAHLIGGIESRDLEFIFLFPIGWPVMFPIILIMYLSDKIGDLLYKIENIKISEKVTNFINKLAGK